MSLVTRGIGYNPKLVSAGFGGVPVALTPDTGGGGSVPGDISRYQVVSPKIYMKPRSRLPDFWKRPVEAPHEVEIKTEHATYPVSFEAVPTVPEAIRADQGFRIKVDRAAKELGVSKRRARSALRNRVAREVRGMRALYDLYLDDDDILEILIIAGII